MNVEELLEQELAAVADQVPVPVVASTALVRVGRRERARRRMVAVAAGVVAGVVVVAGAAVLRPVSDSEGTPPAGRTTPANAATTATTTATRVPQAALEDLPLGAATDMPWWQNGTLHVEGETIRTGLRTIVYRGGITVVGRSGLSGADWYLVTDGRLEPLVSSDVPLVPVVSPDGATIAWVEEVGSNPVGAVSDRVDYRVVAYDVASRRVAGTVERSELVTCCDQGGALAILGIDVNGHVIAASLGGETFAWPPGQPPVLISGPQARNIFGDNWPRGVMWQGQGAGFFDTVGHYGTVDAGGEIHLVGTVPSGQFGRWSADGSLYAYPGLADGSAPVKEQLDHLWIADIRRPGSPTEMHLPETGLAFDIVAWESPNSVIVRLAQPGEPGDVTQGLVSLVRCFTDSGSCERVDATPTGKVVLP